MYTETGKQSNQEYMHQNQKYLLEVQKTIKIMAIKVTIDQITKYYLHITVLHKTRLLGNG